MNTALPARKNRIGAVDEVKFVASLLVILIHLMPATKDANEVCKLFNFCAVPFFFTISLNLLWLKFLSCKIDSVRSIRWKKAIIPYISWSLVYYTLRFVKGIAFGHLDIPDPIGNAFYGEAAPQLYFIPLLVVYQLMAVSFMAALSNPKKIWMASSIFLMAFVVVRFGESRGYWAFKGAFERGLLYIAFSYVLAACQIRGYNRTVFLYVCALGVSGLLGAICLLSFEFGVFGGPLIGLGISGLALNLKPTCGGSFWRWTMTCSYGIYLSHFMFIALFELVESRLGLGILPYSILDKLIVGAFIASLSLLLIKIIRGSTLLADLFLGESGRPYVTPSSQVRP